MDAPPGKKQGRRDVAAPAPHGGRTDYGSRTRIQQLRGSLPSALVFFQTRGAHETLAQRIASLPTNVSMMSSSRRMRSSATQAAHDEQLREHALVGIRIHPAIIEHADGEDTGDASTV